MGKLDELLVDYDLSESKFWDLALAVIRLGQVSSEELRVFVQTQIKLAEEIAWSDGAEYGEERGYRDGAHYG